MTQHEDRSRGGRRRIQRQLVDPAQRLRFADDHHLKSPHHRHLTAKIDDRPGFGIPAVNDRLVEGPLLGRQDRLAEPFGQPYR